MAANTANAQQPSRLDASANHANGAVLHERFFAQRDRQAVSRAVEDTPSTDWADDADSKGAASVTENHGVSGSSPGLATSVL